MPIYDYQCSSCGHKTEVMRKISAANIEACPACGKETFTKQVSAPSFQLTGSGWYATDFKGGANSAQKSEAPATEASKAEASKVEASPATTGCATGCACH